MEGASAIPRKFDMETESYTLAVTNAIDLEE
jgi:hypothetical protein